MVITICSICLDRINYCDTIKTKCGHTFHVKCFDQWSTRSSTNYISCPNCRQQCIKPYTYSNPPHFIIPHPHREEAQFPSIMEFITHMKYVFLIVSIISIFDCRKFNQNWGYTKFTFTITLGFFILSFLLKCLGIS